MNADKPRNREFRTLLAFACGGLFHYLGLIQKHLKQENLLKNSEITTSILIGGNGSRFLHWLTTNGTYHERSEVNDLVRGIVMRASGLEKNPDLLTLSPQPKEEACGGLVVSSGGTRLKGFAQKQIDHALLGEDCVINGRAFAGDRRLDIDPDWEEIKSFEINSYTELEQYLKNFNDILREESIQEIEQLRNFDKGGVLTLNNDFRILLGSKVKQACLKKVGLVSEFEADPPFLLVLKCFMSILAEQWSKN